MTAAQAAKISDRSAIRELQAA